MWCDEFLSKWNFIRMMLISYTHKSLNLVHIYPYQFTHPMEMQPELSVIYSEWELDWSYTNTKLISASAKLIIFKGHISWTSWLELDIILEHYDRINLYYSTVEFCQRLNINYKCWNTFQFILLDHKYKLYDNLICKNPQIPHPQQITKLSYNASCFKINEV
jgi:hypothetical protein